jgi:hypothetical protein
MGEMSAGDALLSAPHGGIGGRPKGLPKTGGRRVGTPNKATSLLREKLDALGCDPLEELVQIARQAQTPPGLRATIYTTLMPYVFPKRALIDNSEEEHADKLTEQDALAMAHDIIRIFGPRLEESAPIVDTAILAEAKAADPEPADEN